MHMVQAPSNFHTFIFIFNQNFIKGTIEIFPWPPSSCLAVILKGLKQSLSFRELLEVYPIIIQAPSNLD